MFYSVAWIPCVNAEAVIMIIFIVAIKKYVPSIYASPITRLVINANPHYICLLMFFKCFVNIVFPARTIHLFDMKSNRTRTGKIMPTSPPYTSPLVEIIYLDTGDGDVSYTRPSLCVGNKNNVDAILI